jgi:hypothetical protein
MSSQKIESDNEQIKNKKEETNNKNPSQQQQQQKEQQTQQIAENNIATTTTTTISETTNEVTSGINENQKINKAILDKGIDITNRYQQQITKAIKVTIDNYNQLQKNILNTYQSAFSKFINDTSDNNNSYNFAVLEQLKLYNKINQNMIDSAINNTRTIHEFLAEYTDTFNKSVELGQEYYSDGIKNYFNFGKKIERT